MPTKLYKPTSPGRRGMTGSTFEEITKWKPEKALTEPIRQRAGRNNQGRITVRPGAQKVDAHQMSRNLVLGPRAAIDTKPGARPHCGTSATFASAANALTHRVLATSSVRSK